MYEIHGTLYVGDEQSCARINDADWAVVHACKHPCHRRAVGYRGNLPDSHPHYLHYRSNGDLYLNIVDMSQPQKHEYMRPMVDQTFDFIDEHLGGRRVLIHCNEGRSRSPTLALLYLAKRRDVLPNEDFQTARQAFEEIYPRYAPATGFTAYLPRYWDALG